MAKHPLTIATRRSVAQHLSANGTFDCQCGYPTTALRYSLCFPFQSTADRSGQVGASGRRCSPFLTHNMWISVIPDHRCGNERKLTHQPSKHLAGFLSLPPESWDSLGDLGPYPSSQSALEDIEAFRLDPRSLLLAVIDLQKERIGQDGFAGVYGLIEVDAESYVSLQSPTRPAPLRLAPIVDSTYFTCFCNSPPSLYFATHANHRTPSSA